MLGKQSKRILEVLLGVFSFIPFTNLEETDDIHAPLLLSRCGLKAEIFISCGTYANTPAAPTSKDDELNSRPEGS